ncbi:MAG: hypothetical protein AB1420_18870, partial [Bacillota bacterium]
FYFPVNYCNYCGEIELATLWKMEMQYYGKITCNFVEKVLAKNTLYQYLNTCYSPGTRFKKSEKATIPSICFPLLLVDKEKSTTNNYATSQSLRARKNSPSLPTQKTGDDSN